MTAEAATSHAAPEVTLRRLSQHRQVLAPLRALLTEAERTEMGRFLRAEDRDRFALARATLREEAARALGVAPHHVRIERDRFAKPRLVDVPELACNVSHSGDIVVVAIGRAREIGVDVEAHRGDVDHAALAPAFMTAGEHAAMSGLDGQDRTAYFFRQWCFKEALVKALGTGLSRDPTRFEILFESDGPHPRFVGRGEDDIGSGWRLTSLSVGAGYSGALAWR